MKRFRGASGVVVSWVLLELSFRVSFALSRERVMGVKIVSQFDAIVEMEYRLLRVWVFRQDSGCRACCSQDGASGGGPRSEKAETSV